MGAAYLVDMLLHPVGILLGVVVLVLLSAAQYENAGRQPIPAKNLPAAYLASLVACAAITATDAYVSRVDALSKWKGPAEEFWHAQIDSLLSMFALLSFASLIGIAAIGLPIIRLLHKRALATVPWTLLSSIIVSVVVSLWMSLFDQPVFRHLTYTLKYVVATHFVICFAFCVGARMQWRAKVAP
jgi:uncharacterized membrane protein